MPIDERVPRKTDTDACTAALRELCRALQELCGGRGTDDAVLAALAAGTGDRAVAYDNISLAISTLDDITTLVK